MDLYYPTSLKLTKVNFLIKLAFNLAIFFNHTSGDIRWRSNQESIDTSDQMLSEGTRYNLFVKRKASLESEKGHVESTRVGGWE